MTPTICTLPDGTHYAVIPNWTSRARACPVALPADVVTIDAETWAAANSEPERGVRYVRMVERIGQRHRRQRGIRPSSNEAEREADRAWQHTHHRSLP